MEFVLPEPFATYSMALARMTLLPAHVFDNDPSKVDDSGYFNSTDMVTSGAYTVAEINEDSIVYEAREDYYRGTPSVKQVIMKTIGSGSTKQIAFENNEINWLIFISLILRLMSPMSVTWSILSKQPFISPSTNHLAPPNSLLIVFKAV